MPGPPPLPGKTDGSLYVMKTQAHEGKVMTMRDVFAEINKSGSGYITFKEFIGWWKWKESEQGTHTISDEILMVSMLEFQNHSGGNGTIELDELYGLVGALKLQETLLEDCLVDEEVDNFAPAVEGDCFQIDEDEEEVEAEVDEEVEPSASEPVAEPEADVASPPVAQESEPAKPKKKNKRLKIFHVTQNYLPDAPENVQLGVGNMSVSIMSMGEVIGNFPYLTLQNWGSSDKDGKGKTTAFYINSSDFETDSVTMYKFGTKEGPVIGDLMVMQAQEMAKEMDRFKGASTDGWDDVTYEVKVHTSDIRGAGTDAQVHIELHGTKGSSGKIVLPPTCRGRSAFERRQVDAFMVKLAKPGSSTKAPADTIVVPLPEGLTGLGVMQKLTVGHDGTGIGAGWYLNKVAVQNMRSHYKLDFVAKRWLDEGEGDKALEITIPDTWGQVKAPEKLSVEKLAIEKEKVIETYRALTTATMRDSFQGGEKIAVIAEGDICECFEQKPQEGGPLRMRIATPSNVVGWVSLKSQTGTTLFKTTRSWGSFRKNTTGATASSSMDTYRLLSPRFRSAIHTSKSDGCSGWLSKKGGMRTNWNKRWFLLVGTSLTYYETNKEGKGQKEKGCIDLKTVHEVRMSEAPGSEEFFEFEVVADDRTYRLRAFNKPEMTHWIDYVAKHSYTD